MNMLKNDVTITPDEVAMNVAHIEGKIKELHKTGMNLAEVNPIKSAPVKPDAQIKATDSVTDEAVKRRIVMKHNEKVNE